MTDFFFRSHHFYQFVRDFILITIHQSNPSQAFDPAKLPQQLSQHKFSVKISAVLRHILSDEDHFPAAFGRQFFRFLQNIFHRSAAVFPADLRDHAVSTAIIASLCDPKCRSVRVCLRFSLGKFHEFFWLAAKQFLPLPPFEILHDLRQFLIVVDSKENIHFRHFIEQFTSVSL